MNERIFELAIKCGIIVMDQHGEDNSDAVQEFAKLIIQECCDIITLYNIKDDMMFDMPPIYVIKKHFGVK